MKIADIMHLTRQETQMPKRCHFLAHPVSAACTLRTLFTPLAINALLQNLVNTTVQKLTLFCQITSRRVVCSLSITGAIIQQIRENVLLSQQFEIKTQATFLAVYCIIYMH